MAHLFRFYVSPDTSSAGEIALPPEEAHHALHVVRVATGDSVILFDGQGREIEGVVSRATHRDVFVACDRVRCVPPSLVRVAVLQAWMLREKSVEFVIQRGTELGVAHFCFFRARHSEKAPRLNPKWRRLAVETCKQCGRAWLPTFEVAADLNSALETAQGTLLLATSSLPPTPLRQALAGKEESILIGPEGDFAPEELRLAQDHGAIPISLGPAVYRSEIAATLAAALVLYELGQLGPPG